MSGITDAEKPKVINLRDTRGKVPEGAVRVDRRTPWGNPFLIGEDGDRIEVIAKYRSHVLANPASMMLVKNLRGKDLACWCAPLPCHADVLLELANK